MKRSIRVVLTILLALFLTSSVASAQQFQFQLGFKLLADQIPDIVGQPIENEWHNPENGDGLQRTTTGMMVWRKSDNWTAFTNGYWTWINGPVGLQSRLNAERFPWEGDQPAAAPPDPTPTAEDRAAEIKANLTADLTAFNDGIPPNVLQGLLEKGLTTGTTALARAVQRWYFDNLAALAGERPLVGHYVRYLRPVFAMKTWMVPNDLLEPRFLDHFAESMAASGMAASGVPPVFPPLTYEEILEKSRQPYFTEPEWSQKWPYGWGGWYLLK